MRNLDNSFHFILYNNNFFNYSIYNFISILNLNSSLFLDDWNNLLYNFLSNYFYFNDFWYGNNLFYNFLNINWYLFYLLHNSFYRFNNFLLNKSNLFNLWYQHIYNFLNLNDLCICYNFFNNFLNLYYLWDLNNSLNYFLNNSWNLNNFFNDFFYLNDFFNNSLYNLDNLNGNISYFLNFLISWNFNYFFDNFLNWNYLRYLNKFLNNLLNYFFNFNNFWDDSEYF